jgi:3-mercaptopyruvate sulfurtransferase SseA
MKQIQKKTLITILIFVIIIIAGFLTLKQPKFKYQKTLDQTVAMLENKKGCFEPWQLVDVLSKVNNKVVLIDIRDKFTFGQGHIPGAENISAYDLTQDENIKHLKDLKEQGMTVVLYGEDQLQANGPCVWYRMVGFDNVKVLLGGYQYFKAHKDNLAATKKLKDYIKEIPKYDYAKVASSKDETGQVHKSSVKKPATVKRRKRATVAAGGC